MLPNLRWSYHSLKNNLLMILKYHGHCQTLNMYWAAYFFMIYLYWTDRLCWEKGPTMDHVFYSYTVCQHRLISGNRELGFAHKYSLIGLEVMLSASCCRNLLHIHYFCTVPASTELFSQNKCTLYKRYQSVLRSVSPCPMS